MGGIDIESDTGHDCILGILQRVSPVELVSLGQYVSARE